MKPVDISVCCFASVAHYGVFYEIRFLCCVLKFLFLHEITIKSRWEYLEMSKKHMKIESKLIHNIIAVTSTTQKKKKAAVEKCQRRSLITWPRRPSASFVLRRKTAVKLEREREWVDSFDQAECVWSMQFFQLAFLCLSDDDDLDASNWFVIMLLNCRICVPSWLQSVLFTSIERRRGREQRVARDTEKDKYWAISNRPYE